MGEPLHESDRTRLTNLETQQQELKRAVEQNTQALLTIAENTQALVDLWKAAATISTLMVWLSKLAAATVVIWGFAKVSAQVMLGLKSGGPPQNG